MRLKEEQCVKRASEEHTRRYDIADQGDIASRKVNFSVKNISNPHCKPLMNSLIDLK